MKLKQTPPWQFGLAAIGALALIVTACTTLTPSQQATVTMTEQDLATALTVAAPLIDHGKLSNYAYAAAAVATAYGKAPVPTNILQATIPLEGAAGAILPLVTGNNNSPKTQAIIAGAAAILANTPSASPSPASSPTAGLDPTNQVSLAPLHYRDKDRLQVPPYFVAMLGADAE